MTNREEENMQDKRFTFNLSIEIPEIIYPPQPFSAEYLTSVDIQRGILLYALTKAIKPRSILEFGTGIAFSAIWFAKAMEDDKIINGKVHTIDDWTWSDAKEVAIKNLKESGFEHRVILYEGKSLSIGLEIAKSIAPVDMVHIDGDHDYPTPLTEFEMVKPFLSEGAYVLFHDTDIDGTHQAVQEILGEHPQWEHITLPLHSEMTIIRKPAVWTPHHVKHKDKMG
jgi:predicted O-methyltransferase YrrM